MKWRPGSTTSDPATGLAATALAPWSIQMLPWLSCWPPDCGRSNHIQGPADHGAAECARCRREVSPRYAAVAKGAGCRHCAIETAGQSIRLDPEAAAELMRAAGLQPLGPYPGAGEPWLCRCATCGRDVTPRYNDVRTGHNGCKRCAQKLAGLGQRIEHETAAAFMLERGLEPLEPYRGAGHQWRCRCLNCGAEVTPRYTNIKQGWGGCLCVAGRRAPIRSAAPNPRRSATCAPLGSNPWSPTAA